MGKNYHRMQRIFHNAHQKEIKRNYLLPAEKVKDPKNIANLLGHKASQPKEEITWREFFSKSYQIISQGCYEIIKNYLTDKKPRVKYRSIDIRI